MVVILLVIETEIGVVAPFAHTEHAARVAPEKKTANRLFRNWLNPQGVGVVIALPPYPVAATRFNLISGSESPGKQDIYAWLDGRQFFWLGSADENGMKCRLFLQGGLGSYLEHLICHAAGGRWWTRLLRREGYSIRPMHPRTPQGARPVKRT